MKISKVLFGLAILFSSTIYNQALIIENDTASSIVIRLNKSTLPTPLLSNGTMEFDPKQVKTIEFKYRGYPNIAFIKLKDLTSVLDAINKMNKNAVIHVEAGSFGGVQIGKTEYVEPAISQENAQETVLKILGVEKSDIEMEPLTKEVAAKILNIYPTSDSAAAKEAFSRKVITWYKHKASNNTEISNYYSSYLLKALKAFEG